MLAGDRGSDIAARGLAALILACVLCAGTAAAQGVPLQEQHASEQAQREQASAPEQSDLTARPAQPTQSAAYHPDCRDPPDHDAADFCQQERMAQAAVDTVNAMRDQNLLVFATIALTALAAFFAWRSALAANLTLRALERPLVIIEGLRGEMTGHAGEPADYPQGDWCFEVTIRVINYGRSPAMVHAMILGLGQGVKPVPISQLPSLIRLMALEWVITPDKPREETLVFPMRGFDFWWDSLKAGESNLYVWGLFAYSDAIGTRRERLFCWRVDRGLKKLIPDGGERHNYERKAKGESVTQNRLLYGHRGLWERWRFRKEPLEWPPNHSRPPSPGA